MSICPYCGEDLEYQDYYGHYLGEDRWDVVGYIYKCNNEKCESGAFNFLFHDRCKKGDDSIREGYPC